MADWRDPYPPVVGRWRQDQVADRANWRTIGGESVPEHAAGKIERRATGITVVNALDPVASGLQETPGSQGSAGHRPVPVGRY